MKRYENIEEIQEDFLISFSHAVVWGDMDAFLHVNNVVYLRYFESARMRFFEETGIDAHRQEHKLGPILGGLSCKYIRPVVYPDTLMTATRLKPGTLKADRFVMENMTFSQEQQHTVAVGEAEVVFYDYQALKKAEIPAYLYERLQKVNSKS